MRPAADSCEEMALREPLEVERVDVNDGAGVNFAICYVPCFDEVTQPLGCVSINLVVIRRHHGAGGFRACAMSAASCAETESRFSMLFDPSFP